jgi:hypothetical protein
VQKSTEPVIEGAFAVDHPHMIPGGQFAPGFKTNFIQNACENKKTANFVGSGANRKGHLAGYQKSTSMQTVMSFQVKILCCTGDFGASFKIVKNVLEVGTHFA